MSDEAYAIKVVATTHPKVWRFGAYTWYGALTGEGWGSFTGVHPLPRGEDGLSAATLFSCREEATRLAEEATQRYPAVFRVVRVVTEQE